MKLSLKLTLALTAGVLLVQSGAATFRVYRKKDLFESEIGRDERVLGRALAYAVERAWATGGEVEAQALIDHANERETKTHVSWMQLDPSPGRPGPRAPRAQLAPLEHGQPVVIAVSEPEPAQLTYVPVHLPDGGLRIIEIADALRDERAFMWQAIGTCALTAFQIVLLCAAITWVLIARFVRDPISMLIEQARGVGEGDLGRRVTVPGNDELRALATEMNRMCSRLQNASDRARAEATARGKAIDQLRHADRLATVGMLASSVAHELGTPINVIKGHAQLIGEVTAEPGATTHVQVIGEQCRRMTEILRQLLDFSRLGRRADETCEIGGVIGEALEMVLPMARSAGVDVDVKPLEANIVAAISAPSLQQIFLNLLINALQAMPSGGRIEVHAAICDSSKRSTRVTDQPIAKIGITDTGPGIPDDVRMRIFEPFFTTKDPGTGTGLGLFIASGIAAEYGGWLEVDANRSETGSVFSINLPLGRPHNAADSHC